MSDIINIFNRFLEGDDLTTEQWLIFCIPFIVITICLMIIIVIVLMKDKKEKNQAPEEVKINNTLKRFGIEEIFYGIDIPDIKIPSIHQNLKSVNLNKITETKDGVVEGDHIENNNIEPCKMEIGKYDLIYKILKPEGYGEVKLSYKIKEPLEIKMPSIPELTEGDPVYIFEDASPRGGVFYIEGSPAEDNKFDPSWGSGIFTLIYVYTDSLGNEFTEEIKIKVNAKEGNKPLVLPKEENESDQDKAKREMIERFNLTKAALMSDNPEDFIESNEFEEEVL